MTTDRGDRRLELEIPVDATPEQLWDAIATGPGISAWFVPTTVDRDSGTIRQDFGSGFVADGRVHASDDGVRFGYGAFEPGDGSPQDASGGPEPHAFEFLVEARDGGGAVLRFVQTGFTGDDWEAEYDAYETGWGMYFATLVAYLRHFRGRPVRNAMSMGMAVSSPAEAWRVFLPALGLAAMPAVGDDVTLTPDGPGPVHGVVDLVTPHFLGVRAADSLHRFGAEGGDGGCGVSGSHYFYERADGTTADDATVEAWHAWITRLFPAPEQSEQSAQTGPVGAVS